MTVHRSTLQVLSCLLTGYLCLGCFDLDKSSFLDAGVDAGPENGDLSWIVQISGAGSDKAYGIDLYAGGDFAVIGQLGEGSVDFIFGQEETQDTVQVQGDSDIFVARLSPSGDLRWVERAGGSETDWAIDVAVSGEGRALVSGAFSNFAVFGQNESETLELGNPDGGIGEKIFAAEYAANGNPSWAKMVDGYGRVSAAEVGTGEAPYLIAGWFTGDAVFGDGEAGETILSTVSGEEAMFIAAYATDGSLAWARQTQGPTSATDVKAQTGGSLTVAGFFESTAVFGQGESNETVLNAAGDTDAFVAMYSQDGSLIWARRAGGAEADEARVVEVLKDGSILVGGNFNGSAKIGPGEAGEATLSSSGNKDVYFAKYDPSDGSVIWARRLGGPGLDSVNGAASIAQGSFVLTGSFQNEAVFGQISGSDITCESAGGYDAFIALFDSEGNIVWARREGGGLEDVAKKVIASSESSVVVAGYFNQTVTFGKGEPGQTELTAEGDDAFVMRVEW